MGMESQAVLGEPGLLARFNALPPEAARQELLACCVSGAWTEYLAVGRPYASVDAALRRSDAAVAGMTVSELADALSGHPRIGERAAAGQHARSAAWSGREQAGVRGADRDTIAALAQANAAYEERFGHIYLVCAAGRSGPELLALLHARLRHDPETEWLVVGSELQKINQLRLRRLLAGTP